jgi:transcriptional regulator with XRE-family HTH domain
MQDFAKLAAQIRGARALLGWSQAYLAEAINVRLAAIADLEACKALPHESIWFAAIDELTAAGVVFTKVGVEFRTWPPNPYVSSGFAMVKKRPRRKYYPRGRGTCAPNVVGALG